MPNNYSLVVNSSFEPLSFQDWLAPAAMEAAEHKEIQEKLAELQENANVWENMINPDNDPGANAMYQNYAEALRKRADNLQKYGLNYNSRKSMYDIKARYNSEIKPIETAFNRRKELAKSQAEAISKDPTRMFQRDASKMSLDTFISDPEANYGWETSGALITSQVSQAAKALAKQLRSEDGKGILKKLGIPYMWDYIHQHGYTDKEVLQAILRDKDASPVLTNLVEQVMQSSGVYGTGDTGLINKTREYANLGLYDAIGETTNQVLTDQAGLAAYKHSLVAPKGGSGTDDRRTGLISPNIVNLGAPTHIDKDVLRNNQHLSNVGSILGFDQANSSFGISTLSGRGTGIGQRSGFLTQNAKDLARKGGWKGIDTYQVYNARGGGDFEWFNADGTLMTKEQFVAQAGHAVNAPNETQQTNNSKQMLGYIYDGMVKTLNELNPDYNASRDSQTKQVINLNNKPGSTNIFGTRPSKNKGMIETQYGYTPLYDAQTVARILSGRYIDDTGKNGKVLNMSAAELNYGKNNNAYFQHTFAPQLGKEEKYISKIHEVTGWNADGSPIYSKASVKTDTFFNKENGNVKGQVLYYIPLAEKADCIVIQHDSGMYVVNIEDLGSRAKEARQDKNTLIYYENKKQRIINKYGGGEKGQYYFSNSPEGRECQDNIDMAYTNMLRIFSDVIGGSLITPATQTRSQRDINNGYSYSDIDDSYLSSILSEYNYPSEEESD